MNSLFCVRAIARGRQSSKREIAVTCRGMRGAVKVGSALKGEANAVETHFDRISLERLGPARSNRFDRAPMSGCTDGAGARRAKHRTVRRSLVYWFDAVCAPPVVAALATLSCAVAACSVPLTYSFWSPGRGADSQ